eukprot:gene2504-3017_t
MQQVRVGTAAFLVGSSFNHSCVPNACVRFVKVPVGEQESQCFKEAIHLVDDNIHVLLTSGTYSMDDVLIAREYVKLMQLCFANGDLAACRRNLETAMRSLRPYVSDDDPDWILCLEIATTINY